MTIPEISTFWTVISIRLTSIISPSSRWYTFLRDWITFLTWSIKTRGTISKNRITVSTIPYCICRALTLNIYTFLSIKYFPWSTLILCRTNTLSSIIIWVWRTWNFNTAKSIPSLILRTRWIWTYLITFNKN